MLCDGLQVELVASLSRLFFLRYFDPRDARHDLQRVHILVSIPDPHPTADGNLESHRRNKNVFQAGVSFHVNHVRGLLRGALVQR